MKERIISALYELPKNNSDFKKALIQETGLNDQTISARAEKMLHHLLQNKSRLAVSTIDKFLLSIIRAFRRELNLPFDFHTEVSEELILDSAIQTLYQNARNDEALYQILLDYARYKLEQDSNVYFQGLFEQIKFELLKEGNHTRFQELNQISREEYHQLYEKLRMEKGEVEKKINNSVKELSHLILSGGYALDEYSQGKGSYIIKYNNYLNGKADLNNLIKFTGEKYQNAAAWIGKKHDKTPAHFFLANENKIFDYVNGIHTYAIRLESISQSLNDLPLNYLMGEIGVIVQLLKEENATFLLSELNQIIADISLNEPVPFIYEFAGERFEHILIDEFQDTSIWQFQGMLPLIDECLSKGGTSLIVGDAKQSIYRFRGGEMRQFIDLPEVYKPLHPKVLEYEKTLKKNASIHILDTNYRSFKNIVAFANHYCSYAWGSLGQTYKNAYANAQQKGHKTQDGYVNVAFFDADNYESFDTRLLDHIKKLLSHGFKASDICILTKTNKSAAKAANLLRKNNYAISITNSVRLNESPEVNALIAVLKHLNDPANTRAFLVLYHLSYTPHFNHEFLFEKYHQLKETVRTIEVKGKTIETKSKSSSEILIENFYRDYEIDTNKHNFINYFDFVLDCCKKFRFDFSDLFLQSFLDMLNQHFFKQKSNLGYFLQFWDEKGKNTTIATPKSEKAIEICTVHKSKGLQFPACILYFPEKSDPPQSVMDWMETTLDDQLKVELYGSINAGDAVDHKKIRYEAEKEMQQTDKINTYYVAITRAEKVLMVMESHSSSPISACLKEFYDTDIKKSAFWEKGEIPEQNNSTVSEEKKLIEPHISSQREIHLSTRSSDLLKEGKNPRSEGNILHFLLSQCHHPEEIQKTLLKAEKADLILDSEIDAYRKKLLEILSIPQLKALYKNSKHIYSERELFNAFGEKRIIDKLIKTAENEYILVEFKTGEKKAHHKKQVLEYADLLNISNISVSKKYLIYTKSKEIELV